jgi:predicted transcriptional regulator
MLNKGVPKTKIAKKFKVHTSTLYDFLKRHGLYENKKNLEPIEKIIDDAEKEINIETQILKNGG